ncbi:hypothetical protein [Thermohalobacter berrensis]|uniref:Lipoprotein n=1 Tax=Thermohalobacter berrensis TaxID=99594 RepID=A0A419T7I0_9FIRM|nr:hypothetical protein [Thermohalobacter berrensis]RKD33431.1 hypothetical protein BET03_09260 [Thermohalobacter berrensis]
MKKLILIFTISILILSIAGCSVKDNEVFIKDFKETSLHEFSMTKFIKDIAKIPLSNSNKNLIIEEFKMGLTKDKKIRLMIIKIAEESKFQNKRYSIFYNKDNNYLKVKENKIDKNEARGRLLAKNFFMKFDRAKNFMRFPEGDYKYYSIDLMGYNINLENGKNKDLFVIDSKGVYKPKAKEVEGICIFVYGEPLERTDRPKFYVIK